MPAKHRSNAIKVAYDEKTVTIHINLLRRPGQARRCETCPEQAFTCRDCQGRIFSFSGEAPVVNGAVVCECGARYPIEAAGPHCQPKKVRSAPVNVSALSPQSSGK